MVEFILNNKFVSIDVPDDLLLIDFLRDNQKLTGTKAACREGDCGSCAVIIGQASNGKMLYRAVASCLTPVGSLQAKHVVTIEGLDMAEPSPIQDSLIRHAAVQCGYCTPGIVISLTGYLLSSHNFTIKSAKESIGGNICRCTGYKSIERALFSIVEDLERNVEPGDINAMIEFNYLPAYFNDIHSKLVDIRENDKLNPIRKSIGGGTDLFVRHSEIFPESQLNFLSDLKNLSKIEIAGSTVKLGAACKISDLMENEYVVRKIPGFEKALHRIGSKLIRNMATLGGNFVNASPIGDLSIIFLALNSLVHLKNHDEQIRTLKLKDFFLSYKKVDLRENEIVESIEFNIPQSRAFFNFEKVCKRKYLDIATVNSSVFISLNGTKINEIHLSFGGVAPIPLFMDKTCTFLQGMDLDETILIRAIQILDSEINPIDDIRGSANYKRLLTRQLFISHFISIFPDHFGISLLSRLTSSNQLS